MNDIYFKRFITYNEFKIDPEPDSNLKLCVVIPCFNEPDVVYSVKSLINNDTIEHGTVEIIIVINHQKNCADSVFRQNELSFNELRKLESEIPIHLIKAYDLNPKHAGVGLARKIGMDEACKRFLSVNHDGVIVCYDADSLCDQNLLTSINSAFKDPKVNGGSIRYEHPTEGSLEESNYTAITYYELFLRYYNCGLRYAGLPYAFHTVGSSMAVRASAYMKQGGMNRRKAGEDFYFLHKIISLGGFMEINNTRIIPSPRKSDRVPFGTGRAILNYYNDPDSLYQTYDLQCFKELKWLVENYHIINSGSEIPVGLSRFLSQNNFWNDLDKLKSNTACQQ